jgi:hypothetical protein
VEDLPPPQCKFFLWLAIREKCWTADNLQSRGLPHPIACPLCDQVQETSQHILTSYVFAHQFWFSIFSPFGLGHLTPSHDVPSFADWWRDVSGKITKGKRKGFNCAIILGAWCLWLQISRAVFEAEASSILLECYLRYCVYLHCNGPWPTSLSYIYTLPTSIRVRVSIPTWYQSQFLSLPLPPTNSRWAAPPPSRASPAWPPATFSCALPHRASLSRHNSSLSGGA